MQEKSQEHRKDAYLIALSELVTYISEVNVRESRGPPILKLADLSMLYKQRLGQLGIESPDFHTTRLKNHLLFQFSNLQAHRKGRDVLLEF